MGISVGQLPVAQLQFEQLERNNWRVQEQQEEQEKQEQEWGAIVRKRKVQLGAMIVSQYIS
jgi:hypothetical protein